MAHASFVKRKYMSQTNRIIAVTTLLLAAAGFTMHAHAADLEVALTIQAHKFTPAEVRVPAGQRIKLLVLNKDDTPEEFESAQLGREKVIPGGSQ
jgi:plastocyanin